MINVVELKDSKLELRSYDITIPQANADVNVPGLATDPEHDAILGFFLFDESYKGDGATLDTKSRLSLEINQEEVVEDAHSSLFLKSPNISLTKSIFKTNIPVNQSSIKINFEDGGVAGAYPRTVTTYLVCKKRQK